MDTFQKRITALFREAKNANYRLNQKEFALRFGASRSQLKGWLSGAGAPSTSMLRTIAKECNVSADWLIGGTDIRTPAEEVVKRFGQNPAQIFAHPSSHSSGPLVDHPSGHLTDHSSGPFADHLSGHLSDHSSGPLADHSSGPLADHLSGHLADHLSGHLSDHPSGPLSDHPSGPLADHPSGPLAEHPSGHLADRPSGHLEQMVNIPDWAGANILQDENIKKFTPKELQLLEQYRLMDKGHQDILQELVNIMGSLHKQQ